MNKDIERVIFSEEDLAVIRKILNGALRFISASDVSEDIREMILMSCGDRKKDYMPVLQAAFELLARAGEVQVFRAGQGNLLRFPELADHIDEVVQLFEDKPGLAKLLSREGGNECYVGGELGEGFENLSMVISRYRVAGGGHGGLAIIGPVRMDYENIIPRLNAYSNAMSEALAAR